MWYPDKVYSKYCNSLQHTNISFLCKRKSKRRERNILTLNQAGFQQIDPTLRVLLFEVIKAIIVINESCQVWMSPFTHYCRLQLPHHHYPLCVCHTCVLALYFCSCSYGMYVYSGYNVYWSSRYTWCIVVALTCLFQPEGVLLRSMTYLLRRDSNWIALAEREIMLFIGKPKGRSMMISNATNPLKESRKNLYW